MTAQAAPTVIYLPFPPSTNSLFRNVPGRGRVKTKRYLSWARSAENAYLTQKRGIRKQPGQVNVWIYLEDRDNRAKDADNFNKAPLDFLVNQGVIEDDKKSIVRSVHAIWSPETEGCMVSIWPAPVHSTEGVS